MPTIQEIRQQYPQYQDLSDKQLVDGLHSKYYSDLDIGDFYKKVGYEQNPTKKVSGIESAITGAGQGVSMGFGDELVAGLSTPVVYAGSRLAEKMGYDTKGLANKTLLETYQGEQQKGQEEISRARQANPKSFLAGEITGSIAGAGKLAQTTAGSKAVNFLRQGSLPTRMAKGFVGGGISSGLYGVGTAKPGERIESGLESAKYGAPIGAITPAISAGLGKAFNKRPKQANSEDIANMARESYTKADRLGGSLKSEVLDKFVDDVEKLTPQTKLGKIASGDSPFTKIVQRIKGFRGKQATLQGAQEVDEALGEMIDDFVDPMTGRVNKQGLKVQRIQDAFRKSIDNAAESDVIGGKEGFAAWKDGQKLWGKSIRIRDIEKIITRAYMTDNRATAIKTGFRNLYNNPSRLRGYSAEERKLIKKAATSGQVGDILRTFGSRLIPIVSAGADGGLAGTVGRQAGSMASRGASDALQVAKANEVVQAIVNEAIPHERVNQLSRYPLIGPAIAAPLGNRNQ